MSDNQLLCHLLLLWPSPLELKDRNAIMLPLPTLPVHTKALRFRLRDAREHAHLHDDFARVSSRLGFHRTTRCEKKDVSRLSIEIRTQELQNLLPILLAKVPVNTVPTPRRFVIEEFERPVSVFDLHF
jgi:hypothetical protein